MKVGAGTLSFGRPILFGNPDPQNGLKAIQVKDLGIIHCL